ncbi:MAG: hypothetical protein LBU19_07915 [Treponema sp.]|jgi:hypothetical protein|nr:hypothetical protein [Treponema sp.]
MNVPRKIIFSLLISALIFAIFAAAAFTGLFDVVETRFYNPQLVRGLNREVMEDAKVIGGLLGELRNRFIVVIGEGAVRRSFLPDRAEEDILERSRIFGSLLSSLPGLRSVRFVDAGGSRIHFSTLAEDLSRQDGSSPAYRGYQDCPGVLPYNEVEAVEAPRLIFDGPGERLIFSYPFTDTLDVYRGSALFTFSVRAVAERMVQEGRIQIGEDVSVVSSPGGFLLGLPAVGIESLKSQAAAVWEKGIPNPAVLDGDDSESLALISAGYGNAEGSPAGRGPEAGGIFVGRLVGERLFIFSPLMRFVLLGSFFLTLFLLVFLLFNLRQDSVAVINSRLNRLRTGLFQQYHEQKRPADWKHWVRELEQRRGEVRAEIKRDLPREKSNSAVQAKIDALIDRSWDEVVDAIGKYPPGGLDEEELRAVIADVLRRAGSLPPEISPPPGPAGIEGPALDKSNPDSPNFSGLTLETEPELLEELEAAGEVEEEPAGNVRELAGDDGKGFSTGLAEAEDAEVLEELEELEEVEELKKPEKPKNEDKSSGEIVITPAAFEAEADLEPLDPPMTGEDLDALASRIEFGPGGEDAGGEVPQLDLSSPFASLSFESPDFSVGNGVELSSGDEKPDPNGDPEEKAKKKFQIDGDREDPGLTEITGDGGLPFIYQPFLFRANNKPQSLRPLEDQPGELIREMDGIHLVNSDILDPKLETADRLDPKFLRLVESILAKKA